MIGRFCLKRPALYLLLLGLGLGLTLKADPRVASVVTADPKTGRLVRSTRVLGLNQMAGTADKAAAKQHGTTPVIDLRELKPVKNRVLSAPPEIDRIVREAAERHSIDPRLVHSVIQVESAYNPVAVSPKGAMGLMQLMPFTARRFGVDNILDVRQNIEGGVKYLRFLKDMFREDHLAMAAYNAGERAVQRYGNAVPPYPETMEYVRRVSSRYGSALKSQSPARGPEHAKAEQPELPPPTRHLEVVTDDLGRIHLRTR